MIRHLRLLIPAAAFAAAFLLTPQPPPRTPVGEGGRSGAMEALEFWAGARAYPSDDIPSDRHYRAFEQARTAALKRKPLPFAGSGWSYIGPTNLSGRMLAVALNPQNPGTIYAGSASGGLWRSRTGGVAGDWERIATGFPVLGVGAIAIDPLDSNVIYIGTGEVYRYLGTAGGLVIRTTRGSYGMGILKTTDGGITWTKSLDWSYNQQRGVQAVKIDPFDPARVWAATSEGIYRSTDAGASWTNNFPVSMAVDVLINPSDPQKILATAGNLGYSNAILRTTNGGLDWGLVTPVDFSGKALLGNSPSSPDVVYASIADSTTGVGSLWRTDDFGAGWTKVSDHTTNNIFGVQGWYSHFVAVHPYDPAILIHAGVPARRSTDGGTTFFGISGTYSDHHAWAWNPVDPSVVYMANDDGIYRSTNGGASFTGVNENLATGQFYNGFSCSASDSLLALGQVQDHIPGYLYTGSGVWSASAADEVGWTGIDQSNDYVMYAGTRDGGSIRKSTNRGVSFGGAGGGFSGLSCWNAPFVVSPSNPNILYFGRSRIFRSTNAAANWTATNAGAVLDGNPALSMAVSPADPNVVYVGTAPRVDRTHVFRTSDGGASWADVTGPLPDRYPLDIAVDPADPSVAYVAYGGAGTGHVFRTTNAGGSWTDLTGDLPDIPVTALLVDPSHPSVVYLGSDIGVYISTNGGGSWEPFGDGLPEAVLVSDLSMTPSNRTLRVATHGNSVWERKMPSSFPSLSDVEPGGGETLSVGGVHAISWRQTLVPSVKLEYSVDDGASWTTIVASVPAWPDSFAWEVPPILTTQARIRVSSTSDSLLRAQSAAPFSIAFTGAGAGIIYDISEDWNLLSLPVGVPDPSQVALFPSAVGRSYGYAGGYVATDTLRTGAGYWLKFPAATLLPVDGDSVTAETLAVAAGWNLVGSLSSPLAVSSVTSDPPGLIITPFYSYDGSYAASDTIRPGAGYWIKTSGPGVLHIGPSAPGEGGSPAARSVTGLRRNAGALTVIDARGRSASLFLSTQPPERAEAYDLPPVPPPGAFDIRFAGGSLAAGAGDHAILASNAAWPVRIAWEIPAGDAYVLSSGSGSVVELSGRGSTEFASPAPLSVAPAPSGAGTISGSPSLGQNYPNPFNPSTRIRYVVPRADGEPGGPVPVSLRVYDVAGRNVATLEERPVSPGEHYIEWDATEHPAGVYFCVLRSGAQARTIKMLLLK